MSSTVRNNLDEVSTHLSGLSLPEKNLIVELFVTRRDYVRRVGVGIS